MTGNNKILVITHGGFIMEFMNVVRSFHSKPPLYNNSAKNTAIFVIKFEHKEVKTKTGVNLKIVPTILVENDNSHLNTKKETSDEEKIQPSKPTTMIGSKPKAYK